MQTDSSMCVHSTATHLLFGKQALVLLLLILKGASPLGSLCMHFFAKLG